MNVKPLAMLRAATKVAAILAIGVSHPVLAANINKQIPAELILGFCADKPANSETRASFTASDGSIVTGTVECDPEDLAELAGDDDGVPGDDDGTPDQGGDNDDDSDDDLDDDNGGDDDSSDDSDDSFDDDSSDDSDDSDDDSSDDSDDSNDDNSGHGGGED